jgi:hypothetical protein
MLLKKVREPRNSQLIYKTEGLFPEEPANKSKTLLPTFKDLF